MVKSNVSCVHSMPTRNDTQMDIEGVATQNSCGDVSCERLNSVTPILAKRTGDTPHLGGDQIPTLTHTFGDSDTPTMSLSLYGPVVSHSQLTRLTMAR